MVAVAFDVRSAVRKDAKRQNCPFRSVDVKSGAYLVTLVFIHVGLTGSRKMTSSPLLAALFTSLCSTNRGHSVCDAASPLILSFHVV
jgi:hypothetical protein